MTDPLVLTHYTEEPFTLDRTRTYDQSGLSIKPHGLWLSDDSDLGWPVWCRDEGFQTEALEHATRFVIAPSANVLHLRTKAEVCKLASLYPSKAFLAGLQNRSGYVDWETFARRFDGILITPYQWSARLNFDATWYYGWDVASACVWNLDAIIPAPAEVMAR